MGKVAKAAMNMYGLIERDWAGAKLPTPTGLEAISAAQVLWKSEVGSWDFTGVILTSGNRYTWAWDREGEITINPNRYGKGWSELVHDLSHLAHNHANAGGFRRPRPHCFAQAKIERRMQRLVLDRLI